MCYVLPSFDSPWRTNKVFKQVERVAHGVAEGYNGTVFAYGQTGSGKTYTMMGGISGTPFSAFSAAQSDPVDYPAQAQQLSPPPEDAARPAPSAGGDESDVSSPELEAEAGVIPRAIARVLADANARKEQGWEFVLTVTYVEIYQEKIRDLLNPCNDNLKVRKEWCTGAGRAARNLVHYYDQWNGFPHSLLYQTC